MNIKHGYSGHKLISVRKAMVQRCHNPKNKQFKDYGARGIFVCISWKEEPITFYEWAMTHGYEEGLCIDRIDNDLGYSPENCRFVTHSVNNFNRRKLSDKKNYKYAKGVRRARNGRWRAYSKIGKTEITIGNFKTMNEAILAYENYTKV